jgi:hypothetical protein
MRPVTLLRCLFAVLLAVPAAAPGAAEETPVTVRVLSMEAKFIGDSTGGARMTIRDADTGALLAEGVTEGSTGDTERLMRTPRERGATLATPGSAAYEAVLDLDRPTRVEITAYGPLAQLQSAVSASTTRWVLPGKGLAAGNGVLLELAGFALDVLAPPAHSIVDDQEVEVRVNLVML